ncbi:MAG: HD domain-containing protein [Patescibacteria group bacterium]
MEYNNDKLDGLNPMTGNAKETTPQPTVDIGERFDLSSFDKMAEAIPELENMRGVDQRTDYHDLPLDVHTREVVKHLQEDQFVATLPQKEAIALAGYLHDLGKTSPEGTQVNPKDETKRQYIGHEKVSEKMARDIMSRPEFNLKPEDIEFVAKLDGLHASALNLIKNFDTTNQPKGKELGAYDDFMKRVEEIPSPLSIEDKLRVVIAFNRADILATYNENSDPNSEKVKRLINRVAKDTETLGEMGKAVPALVEAIMARRSGKQQAGIVFKDGVYRYHDYGESQKTETPSAIDEQSVIYIEQQFPVFGLQEDQKDAFLLALRTNGLPGLGKAGFSRQISTIKKLLQERPNT